MSVSETLRDYVATVRPGDEDALHHLRMLILTMRWIGLEGEVMSAERVAKLLAAGRRPPSAIAHLPGRRRAHGRGDGFSPAP